jgi:Rha family phage regulatory protein
MNDLVVKNEVGALITDSLKLAGLFGRGHDGVLRTIRNIVKDLDDNEIQLCNFAELKYKNSRGTMRPFYVFGEELALIITGRLTGKNALVAQMKLAKEFIAMRDYIRNHQNNALAEYQKQLSVQSSQLALINQREPRDEKTLAVIMNCPTRQVTKHFDILVRNGYLNRKELPPVTRYTYEATQQLGALCIGKKGESLLFDDKVKDLIGLLNQTESLFD